MNEIRFRDLISKIQWARISALLDIRMDDGERNCLNADHLKLRWSIEVQGGKLYHPQRQDIPPEEVHPHFTDQDLDISPQNMDSLQNLSIYFELEKQNKNSTRYPILNIPMGDVLPISKISIGEQVQNGIFDFKWEGLCYPMLGDEYSGSIPFTISGELCFMEIGVLLYDTGEDLVTLAKKAVNCHFNLNDLKGEIIKNQSEEGTSRYVSFTCI